MGVSDSSRMVNVIVSHCVSSEEMCMFDAMIAMGIVVNIMLIIVFIIMGVV